MTQRNWQMHKNQQFFDVMAIPKEVSILLFYAIVCLHPNYVKPNACRRMSDERGWHCWLRRQNFGYYYVWPNSYSDPDNSDNDHDDEEMKVSEDDRTFWNIIGLDETDKRRLYIKYDHLLCIDSQIHEFDRRANYEKCKQLSKVLRRVNRLSFVIGKDWFNKPVYESKEAYKHFLERLIQIYVIDQIKKRIRRSKIMTATDIPKDLSKMIQSYE
jgi:hypothetical protein